jgi:signal transduction histidine kinase
LRRQVEQRTVLLQHEIRERERAERQHALEAERSRIARDLHDDLGSSLTEIGALASKGWRNPPGGENAPGLFRSIGEKARGLIAALDVIVWAVDPEQNTLQSLADYLGSYAEEYMANAGIACRFKIPAALPPVTLDGRERHDLFLAIKESLHNIVQHSRATEVEFHLAVTGAALEIIIADNGCGFVPGVSEGHGLKNLLARMERMGGHCEVLSQPKRGTQVKMFLPLPVSPGAK